ncbi:hypothetical protein ASG81_22485 [Paenibacillus sp. Soil522]|nr:hypothetical protein ASG81_22485 [Paenibacillus sp. Soil522]
MFRKWNFYTFNLKITFFVMKSVTGIGYINYHIHFYSECQQLKCSGPYFLPHHLELLELQ